MATEVGQAYVTLIPSAKGFASKMQSELAGDIATAGGTQGSAYSTSFSKKASSGLKSKASALFAPLKGAVGPLAAVAGAAAIGGFLKDSVGQASDLNETLSKSAQIFGKDALPELKRFASGAATSLGQSKQQALDAASTFAVFGKSAGLGGKDLTGFATKFTGLASDMASFSNTSPQEAIDAIGSALRGEAEPMRKYGVLLDDASMRQEAVKQGLIKTTKEALTPQQKVLAAQALIYKQTGDAQGDFARTSGGLANQQRIAAAEFDNLKSTIGQALLPVMTKLMHGITALLPHLIAFGRVFAKYVSPILRKVSGFVEDFIGTLFDSGKSSEDAKAKISGAFTDIQAIVTDVIAILSVLWQRFGPFITKYLIGTLRNLISILSGAFKIIRGILDVVLGLLTGDWSRAWKGVKEIFSGVWTIIKALFRQALNSLTLIWKVFWTVLKGLVKKAWEGILALLRGYLRLWFALFVKLPVLVAKALASLGRVLWGILTKAWDRAKDAVRSGVDAVVGFVKSLPGRIVKLAGAFGSAGHSIITAFVNGLKNAGGIISGIAGNVWDALRSLINGAIDHLNSLLEFSIKVGPKSFSIDPPDIAHLAQGGRVTRGTLAVIGEGREPETVLPDSMLRGLLGRAAGSGGGARSLRLVVDGYEFNAYVDARADERVSSAGDMSDTRGRAGWQR